MTTSGMKHTLAGEMRTASRAATIESGDVMAWAAAVAGLESDRAELLEALKRLQGEGLSRNLTDDIEALIARCEGTGATI